MITKPRPPADPGPKLLSNEDRADWEQTARTLEPLRGRRATRHASSGARNEPAPASASPAPCRQVPPRPDEAPPLAEIGRRQTRKLSTGQVALDGRLDLHAMTQAEAHGALRRFLASASERDARWVLVITGKGGRRTHGADEGAGLTPRQTGVLRHNVPLWLAAPDLRAVVVGFRPAARAHGGDGALYVQLRQRRAES